MSLPDEEWRRVPSIPGLWASSHGRIKRDPFARPMPHGGIRVYVGEPTFGVIRQAVRDARHLYFGYRYRTLGNVKVHVAVCEAFHGAKPDWAAGVRHLNENGLDNRPSNLEWSTQRRNLNDPAFRQYQRTRGVRHISSMPKYEKRAGIYDSILDVARMRQAIYEARA